jgi:hypothetical protein
VIGVYVSIALAAALQLGTLIYFLGGLEEWKRSTSKKVATLETGVRALELDVNTLKAERT